MLTAMERADRRLGTIAAAICVVSGLLAQTQPSLRWRVVRPSSSGALAYDAGRARIVFFSGDHGGHAESGLTPFEWDGERWRPRHTRTRVASRHWFAAAPSPTGGLLVFGGRSPTGTLLADTIEWDGHEWLSHAPATRPGPRQGYLMASMRRTTVLFGGTDAGNRLLNDTWVWDGTQWREHVGSLSPPPAGTQAMAFDPAAGRVVLSSADHSRPTQTWVFDGDRWQRLAPRLAPPSGYWQAMCYDSTRRRCLLAASDGLQAFSTWEFDGSEWQRVAGGPAWNYAVSLAFDDARGRAYLLGSFEQWRNLYEWDGASWRNATATGPYSTVAYYAAATFLPSRGRTFLFVGDDPFGVGGWEWDGTAMHRVEAATRPDARQPTMTYDASRDRVVMFEYGRTWEWDGRDWLLRTTLEPPLYMAPITYDPLRRKVVLFGGNDWRGQAMGITWEWDGAVWRRIPTAVIPPPGLQPLVFDPARGEVLCAGHVPGQPLQTWTWNGERWQRLSPAHSPPGLRMAAMTYDSTRGVVVLFGGEESGTARNATWEWDGSDWRPSAIASASIPAPRSDSLLVHDALRQRTILFGGMTNGRFFFPSDLWELGPLDAAQIDDHGRGCPGPAGTPRLSAVGAPTLGNAGFALDVAGAVPAADVWLLLGAASERALASQRCPLLVRDVIVALTGQADPRGTSRFPLPIPNAPVLAGLSAFGQAFTLDPAAIALTAGVQLTLGYR